MSPTLSRRDFLGLSGATAVSAISLALAGRHGVGEAVAAVGRGAINTDPDLEPGNSLAPSHPNLVLFVVDDLGWDDVGYHGDEVETPNIDGIAANGVQLDRFYSYPVCSPTRAGLLTGRHPVRTGVTQVVRSDELGLPLDEHMLPETLRTAGYQTWLCGKWHLGGEMDPQRQPHVRGFDHFYGLLGGSVDPYTKINGESKAHDWQRNGEAVDEDGYSTFLLADESEKLIRERDPSRPFFLDLSFRNVHVPLRAPQEYIERFRHIADRRRRLLAAMCATVDDAIGQVLSVLDDEGIRDDTLVVFMSDNGGDNGDGGASNAPLREGKSSMYEGGIRVPAAMSLPGVLQPARTSEQFVAVWDLFPTLCTALGVTAQNTKPLDGLDRWTQLVGGTAVPHDEIIVAQGRRNAAVLLDEFKLVVPRGQPDAELYDIIADPEELHNVADQHPDVVRDLRSRLNALLADAPTPEPTLNPSQTPDGTPSTTPAATATGTPSASPTTAPTGTPSATPTVPTDDAVVYMPRVTR